jgi:hypothetical protein
MCFVPDSRDAFADLMSESRILAEHMERDRGALFSQALRNNPLFGDGVGARGRDASERIRGGE